MSYKFISLQDDCVWNLIEIYSPNDDSIRCASFEELVTLMKIWDIPWCFRIDFKVGRLLPYERSTAGSMSSAMIESSNFLNSYNLIDLPLESAH